MSQSYDYHVYGLNLSANRAIPGLVAATANMTPDVEVWLGSISPSWEKALSPQELLWYASSHRDAEGKTSLLIWKVNGAYFRFQYSDGSEFIVDEAGTQISAIWPDTLTLEDTTTYLLGPLLGFVLLLRGVVSLHASAITLGHRAIALLGPTGTGKSTTAAAFAELGHPVLSDDIVPLREERGTFLALPGYPRLGLWPSSVSALYGSPDALPRLTPTWDKHYLDLSASSYQFCNEPLALAAIYVLSERYDNMAPSFIESILAASGLITLLANTYANRLLDKKMRAREFELLSRVIGRVPLRRVHHHGSPQQLCQTILDDYQRRTDSGPYVGIDHV